MGDISISDEEWESLLDQIDNLNPYEPNLDPFSLPEEEKLRSRPAKYVRVKKKKCECGSEKVYGKNSPHSTWCPKYKGV